jgi:hypothetical protein
LGLTGCHEWAEKTIVEFGVEDCEALSIAV